MRNVGPLAPSQPVPVAQGGTGSSTAAAALTALGALGSGSNTVGAAQLSAASQRLVSFSGHAGAGACTEAKLKIGDVVVSILDTSSPPFAHSESSFESTITINGQIQQSSATDLSTHAFIALVIAKGG